MTTPDFNNAFLPSVGRITTVRSANGHRPGALGERATGGGGGAPIAVLYENADWMYELFAELQRRGLPFDAIPLQDGAFSLDDGADYPLVINRVSPSAYLRGHGHALRLARGWLEMLQRSGVRVINGASAFALETSKVDQYLLIRGLGLPVPKTLVFNDRGTIRSRLGGFPFPAILKPDLGGSGAFVRFVPHREALEALLDDEPDLFGPDHVLLLQQFIAPADGTIVRTEFVDGDLLFAMRVRPNNTFNLCPADGCERPPADEELEGEPDATFELERNIPDEAVAQAREIVRRAGLDVGGIEYLEGPDGRRIFYDINATSVYRPDIIAASGVDAVERLGAFIERELAKETVKRDGGRGALLSSPALVSLN